MGDMKILIKEREGITEQNWRLKLLCLGDGHTKGDGLDSRHAHHRNGIFYWLFYVVNLCSYGASKVYSKYL